jgi:hypothetical protein
MTPEEFLQQAMIHVGAALVKVYDEQSDGIIDNQTDQNALARNARDIAHALLDTAFDGEIFKAQDFVKP